MGNILLLIALLVFSTKDLQAAPPPPPPPSIDLGLELNRELVIKDAINPEEAKTYALSLLKSLDQDRSDPKWLQVFLYLLQNAQSRLPEELADPAVFNEILRFAEKTGNENLILPLQHVKALKDLEHDKAPPEAFDRLVDEYIVLAEKKGAIRFAVAMTINKAYDAYNKGSMSGALAFAQKGLQLLDKKVPLDDVQRTQVKGNVGMYLEYVGDREKAQQVFEEVLQVYRQKKMPWSLADTSFSYGLLLMNSKKYLEAQKAFREVAKVGREIKAVILQGRALKGLGFAQARLEQCNQAIQSYNQGLELMKKAQEDPVAIADTYKLLADCYNATKQWDKAIKALEIAESEPTAMQDKLWARSLQDMKMDAYAGAGNISLALRASKRVNELLDEILKGENEAEISKLRISLGLELEEQKNALLTEQNKAQNEKLQTAETLKRFFYAMTGLFVLVILLLGVALKQTLKARKSQERVQRILEHIEEGILSIGAGMRVEADLSPYLARVLGMEGTQKKTEDMFTRLLEVADLQTDERATIRAALGACLGEDELNWELNLAQLPMEVSIQNGAKQLSLEWQPLYNDARCIQNILITVRDISAKRKLQNEVVSAKAHASRMEQRLADILQIDARAAEAFVNEARTILPNLRPKIESSRDLPQCYRDLHTLKGMARSLGFKEMSSLVHNMEDQLDLEQKVLKNQELALEILHEIEQTVNEYSEIIEKVFFRQSEAAGSRALSLVDLVATSIVPVRTMLERAGLELARVDVQDHVSSWSREHLDAVQILLLHGMTNSADHGFILPRRRGKEVERQAALQVKAYQSAGSLHIELTDNGVGVDLDKMKAMAQKLNFVPGPDETVADVVFMDGASTAEQVSSSSGRGMGMSALRHSIITLEGTVNFRPNPTGKGSSLVVRLPLDISQAA